MAERTREDDCQDLANFAWEAICSAAHDEDSKHAAGSWMNETIEEQLRHIEAHITQYQCGDRNEDHLSHTVCRAAIAVALEDKEGGSRTAPTERESRHLLEDPHRGADKCLCNREHG